MGCQCPNNCNRVVPGLLTNGLGGNATAMILGTFTLFGCTVTIEEVQDTQDIPYIAPVANQQNPDAWITVTYGSKTWRRRYSRNTANNIIHVSNVVSDIIRSKPVSVVTKTVSKSVDVVKELPPVEKTVGKTKPVVLWAKVTIEEFLPDIELAKVYSKVKKRFKRKS